MTQVPILTLKPLPKTDIVAPPTPEVGFRTIRGLTLKEAVFESPELPVTVMVYDVWFVAPARTTKLPERTPVLPVIPHV
jgi:hypothetical protein